LCGGPGGARPPGMGCAVQVRSSLELAAVCEGGGNVRPVPGVAGRVAGPVGAISGRVSGGARRGYLRTVRVKVWLAVPSWLVAVMVMARLPAVPAAGVPVMAAWPFPVLVKLSPLGRVPDSVSTGVS
jgi:hypothetical protein